MRLVLLLSPLLLAPLVSSAQRPEPVAAGTRVRAVVDGSRSTMHRAWDGGTLVRLGSDSLLLRTTTGDTVAVALPDVRRLQVAGGRSASAGARHGAALGLAAGAGIGVLGAIAVNSGSSESSGPGTCSDCGLVFGAASIGAGAIAGAIVGAVVGHHFPREHWTTVPVRR